MKNVLITGTSSGVGFESSILFAENGYRVFATMRNLEKGEELKKISKERGLNIELVQLDVTDVASIRAAVEMVVEKAGRIDVLVNNAGAGFAKTLEQASEEEIDWVTNVNYMGVVRTTKAVLPIMRQGGSGHIINITSVGGLVGQPFNEFYCAAKFAVEGFTEAMASYVSDAFGIQFSLIEPGGIATEFMKSAVSVTANEEGQLATGVYAPLFQQYLEGTQKRAKEAKSVTYQTGKEVAEVVMKVADMENPPLRIRTSEWAEELCNLKTQADPDGKQLLNEVKTRFMG